MNITTATSISHVCDLVIANALSVELLPAVYLHPACAHDSHMTIK